MYAAKRLPLCCFALLIGISFLCGCGTAGKSNPLPVCKTPFHAMLEGTRGDLDFCAELTVNSDGRQIRYTAPESICGLTLTDRGDSVTVEKDGMALDLPAKSVRELLLPLSLLTEDGALASRQKQGDQFLLTLRDGSGITVSDAGVPRFAHSGNLSFRITDFTLLPENQGKPGSLSEKAPASR